MKRKRDSPHETHCNRLQAIYRTLRSAHLGYPIGFYPTAGMMPDWRVSSLQWILSSGYVSTGCRSGYRSLRDGSMKSSAGRTPSIRSLDWKRFREEATASRELICWFHLNSVINDVASWKTISIPSLNMIAFRAFASIFVRLFSNAFRKIRRELLFECKARLRFFTFDVLHTFWWCEDSYSPALRLSGWRRIASLTDCRIKCGINPPY